MTDLELFDSHTHLEAEEFDSDREAVIARARQSGVNRMVTVGSGNSYEYAEKALRLAGEFDCVWAAVGIHPHGSRLTPDRPRLSALAAHPRCVAIGETGLDFYRDWAPRELQEEWFRLHIDLALDLNKPLIIHSRQAGHECLSILREKNAARVGGVFHCYSEDHTFACRLRDINFMVSFPGSVTFKKARELRETVRAVPLEQLMLETDAPFLSPEPHRGKRCESSFMVFTAEAVARVKDLILEEVAQRTTENALRFFKIAT